MKILIQQFLGKNHSWCVVGWGIATSLIEQGHDVHLFSTDGIVHVPGHLRDHIIGYVEENQGKVFGRLPDPNYDCQISYTAPKNFSSYLKYGTKNRFGIWCYEWSGKNVLPSGFAKHYKSCDYICAPSSFQKEVFMDSGIPEDSIRVIPHGIAAAQYRQSTTMVLPTKKKYKILANIAQNHLRKNIPGLLDAYGKAFDEKDDVCLILKAKEKPVVAPFEVSLNECLKVFNRKYPKHAEVKVLSSFIDDMSELYRSVDTVFTMSFGEGFYFPGLEAMAAGKLSIAPNKGGQTYFLDESNALLIDSSAERADAKSMYWEPKSNATWFKPDINDAVDKLRYAYQNYEELNKKIERQREKVYEKYDWSSITTQFLGLCQ